MSSNGQRLLTGSSDLTLQLWALDWDLEDYQSAQWDEGARPYLENFLTLQTPFASEFPEIREQKEESVHQFLLKAGKPAWCEKDFQNLLVQIGYRGYGWLHPEGVRRKLEELAEERV